MSAAVVSQNFAFLRVHEPQLDRLGALAERYFPDDPVTCLLKLRQLGELLARQTAARSGLAVQPEESQADLLRRLRFDAGLPRDVLELFHQVRIAGNRAAHDNLGDRREALAALKIARQLAIWFHRTFGADAGFKPGPFQPPAPDRSPDRPEPPREIADELEALRTERARLLSDAERSREEAEAAEARAQESAQDRAIWEQLAAEAEAETQAVLAQLRALQAAAASTPAARAEQRQRAEESAKGIELDEAATRVIVDRQLKTRGWEADSETLRWSKGARPVKGRNLAIAEWPTESGPADYALFAGLVCLGTVEAKRKNKNVCGALDQSQRYARDILSDVGPGGVPAEPNGGPWGAYRVPFAFSANGRPYLEQIATLSGIWFRDLRSPTNPSRALVDWPTPDGLKARLEQNIAAAEAALAAQPFDFGFPLRPYQRQAIEAVEKCLAEGRRLMLVAMATGTGKTKLSIALLYRLLSAGRFRRVCFVVDRNALGIQARGEFSTTKVVGPKTFADIFDLKGLETAIPEPETKIHICTIQGLVRRVLYAEDGAAAPPIDQYDLIVVDECHRGYLLDRELSDAELAFRSQDDYISKYRRVLEHFDAVKIGLTATPALHTTAIFGNPIFTYSYREAVIDGYLIDHEPPVRIVTALAQAGIHFGKGERIELLNTRTAEVDLAHLPDDLDFEVDAFNRKVVTVPFNQVVAEELSRHIDPSLPGKTLIFAATDAHADIVVDELKQALAAEYGAVEDGAVKKITGSVDKVPDLIRAYRNDAWPAIAVTVDLLTTGIDVPSIVNLVFLRRVSSRILYEQMLGRATRRCDEIGKETFRIFDAVDLYPNLQALTDMRPVAVDPQIGLAQLFEELAGVEEDAHREAIRDQILVRMRRRLARLAEESRQRWKTLTGESPEQTLERLRTGEPAEVAAWVLAHPNLGALLEWEPDAGPPPMLPISTHPDRIAEVVRGYGESERPEDFLHGFTDFVRSNVNRIAALTVVVQRPRELTRAQLKALKLALDTFGYTEPNLRRAWQDLRNEEIAASIVGFVRQAALGDPLIPFAERVERALSRILSRSPWSDPQRKWLKRIAAQIEREGVVDREALDQGAFKADGGFKRLDKVFDGRLEALLGDFNEALWKQSA